MAIQTWKNPSEHPEHPHAHAFSRDLAFRKTRRSKTPLPDILEQWVHSGYPDRTHLVHDYLTAYGALDPHDQNGIKRCIALLGGLCASLQILHTGRRTRIDRQVVWIHGYDPDWLHFNGHHRISWLQFEVFCDQAYGLVSKRNWAGQHRLALGMDECEELLTA